MGPSRTSAIGQSAAETAALTAAEHQTSSPRSRNGAPPIRPRSTGGRTVSACVAPLLRHRIQPRDR
jgi:hypothetical protein